ncbi:MULTISPECIES: S24 family peptidase [Enterobacterales]|uniref:S24 family peptidase n=1 Tax=Citrobacter freundii TaxID=546 RepID=UPI001F49340D|nr:helix-turn-helix transcriptional regulator [Citrobacter freundii]
MVTKDELREKFAERLKFACDEAGVRLHGRAVDIRSALKKKGVDISTTGIGKWLNAEATPEDDKILALADWLNVRAEWLEYGRGEMRGSGKPSPFVGTSIDSEIATTRLKPTVWEDSDQDNEEFVEIPLLDINFSAGNGCYELTEQEEFALIFRRHYLHKMGVSISAAKLVRVVGNSMEPKLSDGDVVGINTDDTRVRDGKAYAIRHGDLLRVKILIEQPDGGITIRSLNRDEFQDEVLTYKERKEQLLVIGRVFWSSSSW